MVTTTDIIILHIRHRARCTTSILFLAAGLLLGSCDSDPPAEFEGGIFDDFGTDAIVDVGPHKEGVVDASGDVSPPDQALDMDLTAGPQLDANKDSQVGVDLDTTLADQGTDSPGDMGVDAKPDTIITTDGITDGATAGSYTLLGELVSGASVSTGGSYRLLSQVGHSMDASVLTGGQYTLRLRAVATIQ